MDPLIKQKTTQEGAQIPAEDAVKDVLKAPFSLNNLQKALTAYPQGIPKQIPAPTPPQVTPVAPFTATHRAGVTGVATAMAPQTGFDPSQLVQQDPVLNLKRDVPIKDIYGVKTVIPQGEALTPYQLKGNKVLLQDDRPYVVNKNQYQNIAGQAIKAEAKPFAPELAQTQESLHTEINPESQVGLENNMPIPAGGYKPAKYRQYTLPGGENYREILIQAPEKGYSEPPNAIAQRMFGKDYFSLTPEQLAKVQPEVEKAYPGASYQSPHWDEPNVISHVRLNDRTIPAEVQKVEKIDPVTKKYYTAYKVGNFSTPDQNAATMYAQGPGAKKVTFMEELQSDWAREAREATHVTELPPGYTVFERPASYKKENPGANYGVRLGNGELLSDGETPDKAIQNAIAWMNKRNSHISSHPLLKNWQELAIKRALKEAVDTGADYLAWTTGEQQQARYNLSKQVDNISWNSVPFTKNPLPEWQVPTGGKAIAITPITGDAIKVITDANGIVTMASENSWKGKNLADVIGKGVGEKILKQKGHGLLSGEGLNIGGEWAKHLYDEQVPNIVKQITGQQPEPILIEQSYHNPNTDIGERTVFTTTQQAIKITPEIQAMVRGEAPKLKQPSGLSPFIKKKP